MSKVVVPFTYILFGSTGDLAKRKIMPALYNLFASGGIPQGSQIIAFSRRAWNNEEYRSFIKPALSTVSGDSVEAFLQIIVHIEGTFNTDESFVSLKNSIVHTSVFCHLAVQASLYSSIVSGLGKAAITTSLLIEKPFGHDRVSAENLERQIETYFSPEKIYRIDHYLGKAGLDRVYTTRVEDTVLEQKLHNKYVSRITCRLVESLTVLDRGGFYDVVGALRDVGQNHLLEMLAYVLMDTSKVGDDTIHTLRARALEALIAFTSENTHQKLIRGQYEGYTSERDVVHTSQTETYFHITAYSSDPRWINVPLVLEAGKALKEKKSEIVISFFDGTEYVFDIEVPKGNDAYVVILQNAFEGNRNRFVSFEEIMASWRFIDSVILNIALVPLKRYQYGDTPLGTSNLWGDMNIPPLQ